MGIKEKEEQIKEELRAYEGKIIQLNLDGEFGEEISYLSPESCGLKIINFEDENYDINDYVTEIREEGEWLAIGTMVDTTDVDEDEILGVFIVDFENEEIAFINNDIDCHYAKDLKEVLNVG